MALGIGSGRNASAPDGTHRLRPGENLYNRRYLDAALRRSSIATSVVGDPAEDLIDCADGALYAAKREGRNCVRAVVQPHPALL